MFTLSRSKWLKQTSAHLVDHKIQRGRLSVYLFIIYIFLKEKTISWVLATFLYLLHPLYWWDPHKRGYSFLLLPGNTVLLNCFHNLYMLWYFPFVFSWEIRPGILMQPSFALSYILNKFFFSHPLTYSWYCPASVYW